MENSSKKLVIKIFKYYFYFYIFVSLSVFMLPRNILDKSEICTIFVNFMKQIFPNIEVFESVSSLPQLTAFYTSVMWVFGIIMTFICLFVFLVGAKAIKYNIDNYSVLFGLIALLFFSISYDYFTGAIILSPRIPRHLSIELSIFYVIALYQFVFSVMSLLIPMSIYVLFLKIKNYFKKDK